jgi:hypothetical protein
MSNEGEGPDTCNRQCRRNRFRKKASKGGVKINAKPPSHWFFATELRLTPTQLLAVVVEVEQSEIGDEDELRRKESRNIDVVEFDAGDGDHAWL